MATLTASFYFYVSYDKPCNSVWEKEQKQNRQNQKQCFNRMRHFNQEDVITNSKPFVEGEGEKDIFG